MNMYRVIAIIRKEFIHILRDPRSLGMAIAMPILLIFLFGSSLSLDVDHVPLVVWDQNGTHESREFIGRFTASRYFDLNGHVTSYAEIEEAIDKREAILALVIPREFSRKLESGRKADVQLIADGSDANTATIAIGYAQMVADGYTSSLLLKAADQQGAKRVKIPVEVQPRVWFNQNMLAKNYIIPGLIAVIMMVISALLTSLTIAREWENGTMEQLITTPLTPSELIVGKLTPYFAIGMLDVVLAVLMGQYLFEVPLRGNTALVFGMAALFLPGALTMGMLISIMTRSQLLASQLAMVLTFLPSFLLSGFMYSIANMPIVIQGLTYLVPSRFFIVILKNIYLKGAGFAIILTEAGILLLFAVVLIVVANIKLKKRLV
ncbi:putative multidrug ABC transporter permease YbhS [bioreactor metagenome]|uniref:Putative multidrug ABC transporter permease YbhS n=1 Tax=bioreactor metagenome TaxID=1076179 RepID=A0A644TFC0_9ZZZZ|nr:ABC transporter permease [Negativicutes bacterium]